jgi:glycerol-3-phosphate cytidylyltransferase
VENTRLWVCFSLERGAAEVCTYVKKIPSRTGLVSGKTLVQARKLEPEGTLNIMKTVISYGTFDLFHLGHVRLLRRLSALGDRLVIGCSTDEFNATKGKKSVMSYAQRVEILESCRYVDSVFPENTWDQKPDDIRREQADIFGMGADWEGKFDTLGSLVKVVYLPRTEGVSTTSLRELVLKNYVLPKN